jgi:peptidoglycan/LPS O-acetylase OafA/YrhL
VCPRGRRVPDGHLRPAALSDLPASSALQPASSHPVSPDPVPERLREMGTPVQRVIWLDLMRALAAQMIVLHHLAFYGPIADHLGEAWPRVIGWLAEHARVAVQVFLVMSGYLVARALPVRPSPEVLALVRSLTRRYLRLFVPFSVAMLAAVLASWPARIWVGAADWISHPPDLKVILAHLTGLFDYLGVEALSAGAWYVSIDFQLHLLVMTSLWCCARWTSDVVWLWRAWWIAVCALIAFAFLWVNHAPHWDITPFYFFDSFALGLAAERLSRARGESGSGRALIEVFERRAAFAILLLALLAWIAEPAVRPAVALITAFTIAWLARGAGMRFDRALSAGWLGRQVCRLTAVLGRSAYSLFLLHFPLAILVNAIYLRHFAGDLAAAGVAAGVAWLGALPLAWLMYRWVERPLERAARPLIRD